MTKNIAVIGKTTLTADEENELDFLGVLIAQAGHQLVTTSARGTNNTVREGFERQEGKRATVVPSKVFEHAEHAVIYADEALLARLNSAGALNEIDHTILNNVEQLVKFVHLSIEVVARRATSAA